MSKRVHFHEFCMAQVAWTMVDQHAGQRIGQSAFNRLVDCRPDLAEKIRGVSGLDPFNSDHNLEAFWLWLGENWYKEPYNEENPNP